MSLINKINNKQHLLWQDIGHLLCSQYLIYADNTSLIPTCLLHISRKIKYFIPIPIVSKQWKQD